MKLEDQNGDLVDRTFHTNTIKGENVKDDFKHEN